MDFLFQHLSGTYGTGDLVNQYAAQVVATVEACKGLPDTRFATFQVGLLDRRIHCGQALYRVPLMREMSRGGASPTEKNGPDIGL